MRIGGGETCAIAAGALRCWGDNTSGQIDVSADLGVVTDVAVGILYVCAAANGAVRGCGNNRSGQPRVPPYDPAPERTPTLYLPMITG